jgi:hypothetical protein
MDEPLFKNADLMEIEFTHGICQDCAKKLYPELDNKIIGDKVLGKGMS